MTIENLNINQNSHRLTSESDKDIEKEHVTIESWNVNQNSHRLTSESDKDIEKRTCDH